ATTRPSGATTNRIISATGRTVPVAAQNRSVPGGRLRGAASSTSTFICACIRSNHLGGRLSSGLGLARFDGLLRGRRQILLLVPARLDASLHDQRLGVLPRHAFEHAGILGPL